MSEIDERIRQALQRQDDQPQIAMPHLDLPAGIERTTVTPLDEAIARDHRDSGYAAQLQAARRSLRDARRLARRADSRPASKARKRDRERQIARERLIGAGIACGLAELTRHDLTITAEQVARIRTRCQERMEEEIGRYAVDVENWIRDLAGEPRLTRG